MAGLREYVVTIGGLPHTLLLDESDAERLGARAQVKEPKPEPEAKQVPAPKNKSRAPRDKQ